MRLTFQIQRLVVITAFESFVCTVRSLILDEYGVTSFRGKIIIPLKYNVVIYYNAILCVRTRIGR